VIYAAPDPKAGAAGSIADLLRHPRLNHRVDVQGGLLADEAAAQLRAFFQTLRDSGDGKDI
jgi:tRNA(adenine34) deaminase